MRLGIVGAGNIAAVMADTVRRMQAAGNMRVTLQGIASRSLEKAERFAAEYEAEKAYGSYEAMMADEDIDFVYIAVPHSHHYETARLALEHGKHVLCEKAFTGNAGQAKALFDLAAKKDLLITEAIWTRYMPSRRLIRMLVESEAIGHVHTVIANLGYPIDHKDRIRLPELCGGALLDLGIYPLNFAEMILGRPDRVQAVCLKNAEGVDIRDQYTLFYDQTGCMAILCADAGSVCDRSGLIFGSQGYIRIENINNPEKIEIYDMQHVLMRTVSCPPNLTGYEYELIETVEAIKAGQRECHSMPHAETLHMMELMDEIRSQMGAVYPDDHLWK